MTVDPPSFRRVADGQWGRIPGAAPPLRARSVLVFWLVGSLLLTVVVLVVIGGPGPLDDPAPGAQRPGILTDVGDARVVSAGALAPAPPNGTNLLVLFERSNPPASVLRDVQQAAGSGVTLAVAVAGRSTSPGVPGAVFVADSQRAAAAVGMPVPRDGGPPIGYALLDRELRVRYATLAPSYASELAELKTIAGGLD